MYEKFFSFKHKPFELIPNPDFLYLSSTHKKALTYLDYGIKERIGFILLTGEIGSGKTTIIRNLIKNIDGSVKLARINNTKVSSEQLLSMINEDFGLDVEGKSKTKLLSELNEFLIDQYSKKTHPILLIDEAQNLSPDLLEEIRLLSNLETDRAKLLQIILVGQPELKTTLLLPQLIQLRQRININYHIAPLTFDETAMYIKHRLTIAGNPDAFKLDEGMLEVMYKFSRGIPRLINIICDFALLTAFVEKRNEVTVDTVKEIVQDLESRNYWSEAPGYRKPESDGKEGDSNITKSIGDIALRLIRLEESISSILPEVASLTGRVASLEKGVSGAMSGGDIQHGEDLSERIARLEQLAGAFEDEGRSGDVDSEGGNDMKDEMGKIGQQVESLTNLVNYLNKKLRN